MLIFMLLIGEIKELFDENRKRVMMETKASVESINQKIEHVWKTQEEQRYQCWSQALCVIS